MIYLGCDPGDTTGLAVYDSETHTWTHAHIFGLAHLYNWIVNMHPQIIICEDFDRREKAANANLAIKSIGVVELYGDLNDIPVELQSASYGKAFWDNGKLKRIDLYRASMKHANDATRHVLQYLSFRKANYKWINQLKDTE